MVIDNRLSSSRRIQLLSTEEATYPNKPRLSILFARVKYSQRVGKVRPSFSVKLESYDWFLIFLSTIYVCTYTLKFESQGETKKLHDVIANKYEQVSRTERNFRRDD